MLLITAAAAKVEVSDFTGSNKYRKVNAKEVSCSAAECSSLGHTKALNGIYSQKALVMFSVILILG